MFKRKKETARLVYDYDTRIGDPFDFAKDVLDYIKNEEIIDVPAQEGVTSSRMKDVKLKTWYRQVDYGYPIVKMVFIIEGYPASSPTHKFWNIFRRKRNGN